MLRFEKKVQNRPVSVSLRMGGRLFTPTFIRGLTLAIGLHLSGFALFQVAPFRIGNVNTIFPPTQVNIDMGPNLDGTVLARPEGGGATTKAMADPKPSTPSLPFFSTLILERDLAYPSAYPLTRFPFDQGEETLMAAALPNLSPRPSAGKNRIEVEACGSLAAKTITNKSWAEQAHTLHGLKGEYLAVFDVRVEDRTGKVFWEELRHGPNRKKLANLAREIVQKLQFAQDPNGGISLGRVEITFTGSE